MRFDGQNFVVTGASRGIGRAIAAGLGSRGATVAVHYRDRDGDAQEVVDQISAAGGTAFAVGADLASADGPARLAESARAGFGTIDRLDGLVLNAGRLVAGGLGEVSPADVAHAFALNFSAPLALVEELSPLLGEGSRVVTVSAAITRWANPDLLVQAAAKAALQNLSLNLAAALGPRGVSVVDVAPGVTRTDLAAGLLEQAAAVEAVTADTALRRIAEPEDVAEAVVALLSGESRWVTGQSIDLSGGYRL